MWGSREASPPLPDYIFGHAAAERQRLDLPRTYAPDDFDVVDRYAGLDGSSPEILAAVRLGTNR